MQPDQKFGGDRSCLDAILLPQPQFNTSQEDYSPPPLSLDDFVSKKEFLKRFPKLFREEEFNWIIKIRKFNGFDHCVRKIGKRKLLFHVPSVLAWIDSQAA
jgi:hypothetical protein